MLMTFATRRLGKITVWSPFIFQNLSSFDFSFVVKGIRLCVWHTKQLNIGGNNLTNVQYSSIGSQVKFIDTIKYYQQSLSSLAKNTNAIEKANIRHNCKKFIEENPTYSPVFLSLSDENKNWILDHLWESKGVIPYEKIKTREDLDAVPEDEFF